MIMNGKRSSSWEVETMREWMKVIPKEMDLNHSLETDREVHWLEDRDSMKAAVNNLESHYLQP